MKRAGGERSPQPVGKQSGTAVRGVLRSSTIYAAVQYVALALAFVRSIYVAGHLGPTLMGTYGLILLVIQYQRFANLGVYSAMNLEAALGLGEQGQDEYIAGVFRNALTHAIVIASLLFAGSVFVQLVIPDVVARDISPYVLGIGFIGAVGQFKQFTIVYSRLHQQFRIINLLELWSNVVLLLGVVLFIERYGLSAVVGAMVASASGTLLICLYTISKRVRGPLGARMIPRLAAIGLPLFLYGLFESIFGTIDKWVIVNFLTREDLGYFSLSYAMMSSTILLLGAFTFLYYPRFLKAFKLKDESEAASSDIVDQLKRYSSSFAAVSVGLGLVGMMAIEPLIHYLLPQYVASIFIYRVLMLGMLADRIAYFAGTLLISNRQQYKLMGLLALVSLVALGLGVGAVQAGLGVQGIAAATSVTLVLYAVGKVCLALWRLNALRPAQVFGIYGKYFLLLPLLVGNLLWAPSHLYATFAVFLWLYSAEAMGLIRQVRLALNR